MECVKEYIVLLFEHNAPNSVHLGGYSNWDSIYYNNVNDVIVLTDDAIQTIP